MRLATLRRDGATAAVRVDEGRAIEVIGFDDVGQLLAVPEWRSVAGAANGPAHDLSSVPLSAWAPVVPRPGKVICVGLNYRAHILEMGRELPDYPTLFSKFAEALIGAGDPITLAPDHAEAVDWEGELAVVIGSPARRVDESTAASAIAGYAVFNDVTMRDFQYRTQQWLQGKTFEATSPFGPYLVTPDEFTLGAELRTEVNGELVQTASTSDLVFTPAELIAYVSQIVTLHPGDVIATGTPGGVGHARKPPMYLRPGSVLTTSIDSLGSQRNPVTQES